MPLDLCDYERRAALAIEAFWGSRDAAAQAQADKGVADAGARGAVTAGKNMDGFLGLLSELVRRNGLPDADIHVTRGVITLPGYFRPTKKWDMLVIDRGALVAVIELKSQVGPSFSNNYNNRCEEALGSAHDLATAYREGALGENAPRPFMGWLIHLEDCAGSTRPVRNDAPHFPVMPDFQSRPSYAGRYEIMCRKMVQEQLYDAATLILSERSAKDGGAYRELSPLTSLKAFVSGLAGHVAKVSA